MATNNNGRVPTLLTQLNLHQSDTTPQQAQSSEGINDALAESSSTPANAYGAGTYQKQKVAMPKINDNGLNKAMAEAAAAKYEKDKEKIQKACAEIDNPTTPKESSTTSCCVIL